MNDPIESLLASFCKHVGCSGVKSFEIKGKLIEGIFEDSDSNRTFRILVVFQGKVPRVIMATADYCLASRTYKQDERGEWMTL